jgi:hypothetical protein
MVMARRKRTEDMIHELYAVLEKYLDGGPVCRYLVLRDIDFILHRRALNLSVSLEGAAKLLMVSKEKLVGNLVELELWDCHDAELGISRDGSRNISAMFKITLPMGDS